MTRFDAYRNALEALELLGRCDCAAVKNTRPHRLDCAKLVSERALRDLAESEPLERDEKFVDAAAKALHQKAWPGEEWPPHDAETYSEDAVVVLRLFDEKLRPGDLHGGDADPEQTHCSQCGQLFTRGACGPTHAAIQAYRKRGTP